MKLIPARCPSCGADIEVNKENETTKCKYCDTRIIIDDAIAKYKVELSGKVTVENLPTVINLIKLGTRHLDKNEYKPAQEKFAKALELDADNSELIIKDALARVAQKEIVEASLNRLLSSIRDAKEYCKEKELEEYVMYCVEHLDHKRIQVIPVLQSVPQQDIFFNLKQKFITYLNFYERVLRNHLIKDENKAIVIRKIFACIQNYRDNNKYKVYDVQSGKFYTNTYRIPKDMKEYLEYKEHQYQDELAKVDPEYNSKLQQQRLLEAQEQERLRKEREEKERKRKERNERIFGTNPMTKPDLYISGFLLLVIIFQTLNCSRATDALLFIGILILSGIICTPLILLRLIKPLRSIPKGIVIALTIFRYFVVIFLLGTLGSLIPPEIIQPPQFISYSFISADSTERFTIGKKSIGIESMSSETGETISKLKYAYTYEEESDGNYILTIGYGTEMTADDTNYRYNVVDDTLCLLNYNKKCITTYTREAEIEEVIDTESVENEQ